MRANLPDYWTKEEELEWTEKRDRIGRFGYLLVEKKIATTMRLKELQEAVELELDRAVKFERAAASPPST